MSLDELGQIPYGPQDFKKKKKLHELKFWGLKIQHGAQLHELTWAQY
jgi:hypothetical protein